MQVSLKMLVKINLLAAIQDVMPHNSQTSGLYSTDHLKHTVPHKE